MNSPSNSTTPCAAIDAVETQKMLRSVHFRCATTVTATTHPEIMPIIEACRAFFDQPRQVLTFKDCECQAWGIVLIDPDQIKREYVRLRKALDAKEEQDSIHRVSDPASVVWFAVAHEFAHCLQSTETSWHSMKADRISHEIGADFLAGVCIGWHVKDFDVNFLNDIDFAFQLGYYKSETHPEPHQRRLALSSGVSQGAKAFQACGGDLSKVNRTRLLACSRDASRVVLKATTRK
jgi:hypothetical protein